MLNVHICSPAHTGTVSNMQMLVFHWTDGIGERMRLIGQGELYDDVTATSVKLRDFSKPSDTKE